MSQTLTLGSLSIEHIAEFDDQFINELLRLNSIDHTSSLVDRLASTIILSNAGYLKADDLVYVRDPMFTVLSTSDDPFLLSQVSKSGIKAYGPITRVDAIRALLNKTAGRGQVGPFAAPALSPVTVTTPIRFPVGLPSPAPVSPRRVTSPARFISSPVVVTSPVRPSVVTFPPVVTSPVRPSVVTFPPAVTFPSRSPVVTSPLRPPVVRSPIRFPVGRITTPSVVFPITTLPAVGRIPITPPPAVGRIPITPPPAVGRIPAPITPGWSSTETSPAITPPAVQFQQAVQFTLAKPPTQFYPSVQVPPPVTTTVRPTRPVLLTQIPPLPIVSPTPSAVGQIGVGVPMIVTSIPGRNKGSLGYYQLGTRLYLCGGKAKKNEKSLNIIPGVQKYGKICWSFPFTSKSAVTSAYYSILRGVFPVISPPPSALPIPGVVSPFQATLPPSVLPVVSPGVPVTGPSPVVAIPAKSPGGIGYYRIGNDLYLCGSKTYRLRGTIGNIPGAIWDRFRKCWKFPLTSAPQIMAMYQSILALERTKQVRVRVAAPPELPKKVPNGIEAYKFPSDPTQIYLCGTKVMQNKKMAKSIPGALMTTPPKCFAYPISQKAAVLALKQRIINKIAASSRITRPQTFVLPVAPPATQFPQTFTLPVAQTPQVFAPPATLPPPQVFAPPATLPPPQVLLPRAALLPRATQLPPPTQLPQTFTLRLPPPQSLAPPPTQLPLTLAPVVFN